MRRGDSEHKEKNQIPKEFQDIKIKTDKILSGDTLVTFRCIV